MMDRRSFEALYRVWLEGALPPAEAAEMAEYCRVHPDVRDSADAERTFDLRIREALVAGEDARGLVAAAIARARDAAGTTATTIEREAAAGAIPDRIAPLQVEAAAAPVRRGRVFRPFRWAGMAAAASALVAATMWFNCIPPFECPVLQAMEAAAAAPADGTGELCGRTCDTLTSGWSSGCTIRRTRVPVGDGDAVVLHCPSDGHLPSFRRERRIDGVRWWVAEEHGRRIAAFEDPGAQGLWCFVGDADEATLLRAAAKFRADLVGRSN
jgi:hypothetical protein